MNFINNNGNSNINNQHNNFNNSNNQKQINMCELGGTALIVSIFSFIMSLYVIIWESKK